MVPKKKKISWWFIVLGAVLSGYAGYLLNGAWEPGGDINSFLTSFNEVCAAPFANYYNERTVQAVGIALMVYVVALLMYVTSQRNFMPGKEFGTARFESPQFANKVLMDKDESFNRILSQNVKMSLDFRRLKLNGNILICGGSGAGKTFYEVKPNLMQMPRNCSFICTDPKGEILRSCGQMLKDNGYNVKVINLLEMDKSDCYNPFSYIREETDVVKLITNLISNTTPKGATPSDPFWEKAEGLFLQAVFYYVWLEVPPAMRNFEMVLQLIGEAEVTEKNQPSNLDVRMKFLEESSPLGANHPAVKQYNKCMRGAGDTVRSIIISANSRLAFLENKQVLVIAVIGAVGVIILAKNVMEFAQAYQQQDSSTMNSALTTMLANSEFVALLKQANTDSSKMAEVIGVSEAQLRFVTNTQSGMGLMKCGNVVIPFDNTIEKGTDLYNLYNTNIHELIAMKKSKNAVDKG